MRREICGECGSPINDDGACDCTELLKRGWRQCAVGQKTTQWCQMAENVHDQLVAKIEALRAKVAALQKSADRQWIEGYNFAIKACGWQEGEDPFIEGQYVVRDSYGNVEIGSWFAKTETQPAGWVGDFHYVDRDDIVAWMPIPDWRTTYKPNEQEDTCAI